MDLKKSQNDIVSVGFWINSIALLINIFYQSITLLSLVVGINMVLWGVHLIITKNFLMFQGILTFNKFANKLNNKLEEVHGEISG